MKYFKFNTQTATIIGNMLSAFCENAVAETKPERENIALCRNIFFEFLEQHNKQLTPEEIAEIEQALAQPDYKEVKSKLIHLS